jgi:hypothetical protein
VAKPRAPFEEEGLVRFHETQAPILDLLMIRRIFQSTRNGETFFLKGVEQIQVLPMLFKKCDCAPFLADFVKPGGRSECQPGGSTVTGSHQSQGYDNIWRCDPLPKKG